MTVFEYAIYRYARTLMTSAEVEQAIELAQDSTAGAQRALRQMVLDVIDRERQRNEDQELLLH